MSLLNRIKYCGRNKPRWENADLVFYCRGIEGKANIKLENPGIMITLEIEAEMYKERKSE